MTWIEGYVSTVSDNQNQKKDVAQELAAYIIYSINKSENKCLMLTHNFGDLVQNLDSVKDTSETSEPLEMP